MSSDKTQSAVGGTAAAIGSIGNREGGLSAAMKRAAVDNASVSVRLKDDKGEALDAALTDSAFMAKTDGDLKSLSGQDLFNEMRFNPETQAKTGTSWAQVNIARAGLDQEVDKLIEGTPVVEERQAQENIKGLLASKTLMEMTPIQVKFLQQNLERLGLYNGKIDGDFTNPAMVASLDSLAHAEKTIEKSMKGSRASLDFVWALRNETPKMSEPALPSGEAKVMTMFKEARAEITSAAAPTAATPRSPDPRLQPIPSLA